MQILPAIDIDGGRVARGARGASGDPLEEARACVAKGVGWVHVVDMDRVFGTGENDALVEQMARISEGHLQLGGGLTGLEPIRTALGWGVGRVVVGPSAVESGLGELACEVRADRLAASIDVRAGRVYARSAGRYLTTPPHILVDHAVDVGVRTVVYRDLDRDGQLEGADHHGARQLLGRGAAVMLAGGIASLDEIRQAAAAGLAGVIVGRAVHEGRFTFAEALSCLA